jgi:hypothetical protein
MDILPSVRTVLPPSATRVKAEGREAATEAATKEETAARENFILTDS